MKALILALAILLVGCSPQGSVEDAVSKACGKIKAEAEVMDRAAQICATELIGCSLTFEDVQAVVKIKRAAKMCTG